MSLDELFKASHTWRLNVQYPTEGHLVAVGEIDEKPYRCRHHAGTCPDQFESSDWQRDLVVDQNIAYVSHRTPDQASNHNSAPALDAEAVRDSNLSVTHDMLSGGNLLTWQKTQATLRMLA